MKDWYNQSNLKGEFRNRTDYGNEIKRSLLHNEQLATIGFFEVSGFYPCCKGKVNSKGCVASRHSFEEHGFSMVLSRCRACHHTVLTESFDSGLITAQDVETVYGVEVNHVRSVYGSWRQRCTELSLHSFFVTFTEFLSQRVSLYDGLVEVTLDSVFAEIFPVAKCLHEGCCNFSESAAARRTDTEIAAGVETAADAESGLCNQCFIVFVTVLYFRFFASQLISCFHHSSEFQEHDSRKSRSVKFKYFGASISHASFATAPNASEQKKQIIKDGFFELYGNKYEVDMGKVIRIPCKRLKKDPEEGYEVEQIDHMGYVFSPSKILKDSVGKYNALLALKDGGLSAYQQCLKMELVAALRVSDVFFVQVPLTYIFFSGVEMYVPRRLPRFVSPVRIT